MYQCRMPLLRYLGRCLRRRLFPVLMFSGCAFFLFTLSLTRKRVNTYPWEQDEGFPWQQDKNLNAAYAMNHNIKNKNKSFLEHGEFHQNQTILHEKRLHMTTKSRHDERRNPEQLGQSKHGLLLSSKNQTDKHYDSLGRNISHSLNFQTEQNLTSMSPTINFQTRRRNGELVKQLEAFEAWKIEHEKMFRIGSGEVPPPSHVNDSNIWCEMLTKFPMVFRRFMKPFLPEYRNPCFHQNDNSLRCLPYFISIGAAKCGSTDLYYHITRHPQVVRVYKEPHFWTHMPKTDSSISKYLDSLHRFTDTVETKQDKESLIFGDGSPSYIWENNNLPRINGELIFLWADVMHAVIPGAKIIMILRNPTNRTISHYFYSGRNQTPKNFHKRTVAETNKFKQCLKMHSLRECATRLYQPRIMTSVYIAHVREWLRVYPRDQVLILRTEDWHNHSNNDIFKRIFKFLEIDELSEAELPAIGENQVLAEMESKKATEKWSKKVGHVLPETRAILDEFFEPYNKELAELLGDDLFLWKD